ncbi:hypothetical protein [Tibeticola sp.]|nr:hypothetical protein [Tibeticola sp.]
MTDTPVALMSTPEGYADWLAELKGRIHLPSIERIERELQRGQA